MDILDSIHSPADLKKLPQEELAPLAREIRQRIVSTAAKNGGHLASNLGMVEAEIALHRVFDCPRDTIIFDVGHQAYAHKLITGRSDSFGTLRQSGGISGFTNRGESEYDAVTAGHSGTALSTAIGIAEANKLAGSNAWTVAVVGDGSFTNGMVFEAMNQLDDREIRLILLLNDNQMSISKNVGGMSRYLSYVRVSKRYFNFKLHLKRFFGAIPLVGKYCVSAATAVRDFLKRLAGAETWFESFGLDYIGPVNGNDIGKLTTVLTEAKHKTNPVVVHMMTKKGLGYAPAEEHPERFHSTSCFSEADGSPIGEKKRTFTDELSDLIVSRARDDGRILAVTAAMTEGCGLTRFKAEYPERFFDVGIAEEHAVAFSSGLSIGGRLPVLVMYSTFSQRVFDQLWHDFCLQNKEKNDLSLVLMLSHGGLVPGDGVTHQGVFDVALLSRLPEVTIYSPDTFEELGIAFDAALARRGLTIVRYPKAADTTYEVEPDSHGTWKSCSFGDGEGELVVTYGRIAANVVRAAKKYSSKSGRRVTVAVLERIAPLPDDEDFARLLRESARVVFIEEGIRSGGIGEALAASGAAARGVEIIAIDEPYIRCGTTEEIIRRVGLDADSLADALEKPSRIDG